MNVTLIGMPGVGKSFLGEKLARKLNLSFLDIDKIMEGNNSKSLQELLDSLGPEKFIDLEEKEIIKLKDVKNSVISPGGSVIYSEKAMALLKEISVVIFLEANLNVVMNGLSNLKVRGIVGLQDKSIQDIFLEREGLFKKHANIVVNTDDSNPERMIDEMLFKIMEIRKQNIL
ncbi:shikimate kinase [Candidatus Pacearchaeota archaeon]|nr:shikimate kinase [Candidatus Pacearchaeota archaeon]